MICTSSQPASDSYEFVRQAGFMLIEELSQDDHGTVYKARERTGRFVSILVLQNPSTGWAWSVEARKATDQAQASRDHADRETDRGRPIGSRLRVVSQYVAGQTLTQWISQNGLPMPRRRRVWC